MHVSFAQPEFSSPAGVTFHHLTLEERHFFGVAEKRGLIHHSQMIDGIDWALKPFIYPGVFGVDFSVV